MEMNHTLCMKKLIRFSQFLPFSLNNKSRLCRELATAVYIYVTWHCKYSTSIGKGENFDFSLKFDIEAFQDRYPEKGLLGKK